MSELDKFKRRLIRSVARILRRETPSEAVWDQLQNSTGCDCKLLWERMRALTLKKMKRLVIAEDRVENIATVARLSMTDWLLFDLVLVHEKLDVIGRDLKKCKEDSDPLVELFDLVQRYEIDRLSGEPLLDAWAALTREYNSDGRQCSPMLLQRRWYQMKEQTRANFYQLWHRYRGNQRLWTEAQQQHGPSPLQAAIAKRFPQVITKPFPEWEELIEKRMVILQEEFEMKMRMKNKPKVNDGKPDLVMIEPQIETIDLGEESDDGDSQSNQENSGLTNIECKETLPPEFSLAAVKQEPPEDGLSHVQILEATHIPIEGQENSEIAEKRTRQQNLAKQISNFISSVNTTDEESATETSSLIEDPVCRAEEHGAVDEYSTAVAEDPNAVTEDPSATAKISGANNAIVDLNEDSANDELTGNGQNDGETEIPDDMIKQKADAYFKNKIAKSFEAPVEQKNNADVQVGATQIDDVVDDIKQKADDVIRKVDIKKLVDDVVDEYNLPMEMSIVDDGIEVVDDGIEYEEECDDNTSDTQEEIRKEPTEPVINTELEDDKEVTREDQREMEDNKEDAAKFDLKLLMHPVIYTTKLDDMIIFKGKSCSSVDQLSLIDSVLLESKPVMQTVKIEIKEEKEDNQEQPSVTQIEKVVSDDLFQRDSYSDSYGLNDDAINDDDISDDDISEDMKVKPTSYLLQKPRSRSYNPIQLCKNPDFNTRLKRLTAGFFSSVKNRHLLSACKPMTIDLSKAFETKLMDGTLYLKKSGDHPEPVQKEDKNERASSVLPSAMAVQSLIGKDTININELVSSPIQLDTVDLTQRSKVINLRDLSEIRRINQHLLTAQVPPMRADNLMSPSTVDAAGIAAVEIDNVNADQVADKQKTDASDEPKVVCISGGQDLLQIPAIDKCPQDIPKPEPGSSTYSWRGRGRGRGRGSYRGGVKSKANMYPLPCRSRLVDAPWLKAPMNFPQGNLDDFLITIDTLNRMINKLDGNAEFRSLVKKKPLWAINKKIRDSLVKDDHISATPDDVPRMEPSPGREGGGPPAQATKKEKKKKEAKTMVMLSKVPSSHVKQYPSDKFCCWSAEKNALMLVNRRMRSPHSCPSVCKCCCRQELADEIKKAKKTNQDRKKSTDSVVLSSDECQFNEDSNSGDVSIVEDVPTPKLRLLTDRAQIIKTYEKDRPQKIRVISEAAMQDTSMHGTICSHENSTCTSACGGRGAHFNVAGVSAAQPLGMTTATTDQQPLIRINVSFGSASDANVPTEPPSVVEGLNDPQIYRSYFNPKLTIPAHVMSTERQNQTSLLKPIAPKPTVNRVTIPVNFGKPSIKTARNNIVIDASSSSLRTNEKKDDHIMFLNSKNILKKPKESPIYLGKNKILLTTVKFPPNFGKDTSSTAPPVEQTPFPTLMPTLPSGVQLVVLPNGGLSYAIDPAAQLTEAQISFMPSIIAAVQEQINLSQAQQTTVDNATNEPISESQEINNPYNSSSSVKSNNIDMSIDNGLIEKVSDGTIITSVQEDSNSQVEMQPNHSIDSENITSSLQTHENVVESANNLKDLEISNIEDTVTNNSKGNKDKERNEEPTGSRNLLSDLMEMSGISAEDATPTPQDEVAVNAPGVDDQIKVIADNATPQQDVLTTDLTTENSNDADDTVLTSTQEALKLPELSPITSLAELKYACNHNGQFFKLDFDTGVIVPINVCIKRNVKAKARVPMLAPKAVIDLTDEEATTLAPDEYAGTPAQPADDVVKPVKLFKSYAAQGPLLLLRKRRAELMEKKRMVEQPHTKHPRKQKLAKIEAKIDLVDSDEPMEEEYLVDTSDSEDNVPTNTEIIKQATSATLLEENDDSSDEEPLAIKSMRMKSLQNNDAYDKQKSAAVNDKDDPNQNKEPSETPKEVPSRVLTPTAPPEQDEEKEPDNLNLDDMELEESQLLTFLSEENESQEDDCILGF